MQKRRPLGDGVVLLGGNELAIPTKITPESQAPDAAESLRALRLLQRFDLRPTLASDIAALAFGEARP